MRRFILATSLACALAVTLFAQDYYGSANLATATGNLPVSKLNSGTGASSTTFWRGDGTWATAGGGVTSSIAFTAGSIIQEISNGTFALTDSTTTGFSTLQFGNTAGFPKLISSANHLTVRRQDNASVGLGFGGTLPASCSPGDIWADPTAGLMYLCNALSAWQNLGTTALPTSVVSGTSPSLSPATTTSAPSIAFRVNVGTGGVATQITFSLPAATTNWNCQATDLTARAAHTANTAVVQLSGSTTAVVLENQNVATGAAAAFAASDIVAVVCHGF